VACPPFYLRNRKGRIHRQCLVDASLKKAKRPCRPDRRCLVQWFCVLCATVGVALQSQPETSDTDECRPRLNTPHLNQTVSEIKQERDPESDRMSIKRRGAADHNVPQRWPRRVPNTRRGPFFDAWQGSGRERAVQALLAEPLAQVGDRRRERDHEGTSETCQ
jgi:hypothetical protein